MVTRSWTIVGFVGIVLFAAGCDVILGLERGRERQCRIVNDCAARVTVPECRKVTSCSDGQCIFEDVVAGTPLPSEKQTPGDCRERVCDGAGNEEFRSANDVDDGNSCTNISCNGSTPSVENLTQATCYSGPPGTAGAGTCKEGIQQCNANGSPNGTCVGEVIPYKIDICQNGLDDDCDGMIDEEPCFCGDGKVTAGEECDDGGNASIDGCSSDCAIEKVVSIAAGWYHTCAIVAGGVKCWGRNNYGQLGLGDRKTRGDGATGNAPPVALGVGKSAVALAAGAFHTCALLNDGNIKCWGLNGIGQLGLEDTKARGDEPEEMGDALPSVFVASGETVRAITTGAYSTCAQLNTFEFKCWGANASGQLGLGDSVARGNQKYQMGESLLAVDLGDGYTVTQVDGGGYFACALLQFQIGKSLVKCWGENRVGQLGLGDANTRGDSPNEMGNLLPAISLGVGNTPRLISVGNAHACAVIGSGLKCWGENTHGQLGLGDTAHRGNEPGEMAAGLAFVAVGSDVESVSAGSAHTCALLSDKSVKCWGWNGFGQLGLGDIDDRGDQPGELGLASPVVEPGIGVTMIAAGYAHTCALLNDGTVKCWGQNTYGQLGLGDVNHRGDEAGEMGEALPRVKMYSGEW